MKYVEAKLHQLKEDILELTHVVKIQVQKTRQLIFYYDADLAYEIIKNSNRIEIMEIQIEHDCRNFLALHNPVAKDLRLILSALKIIESLKKIGLYSKNIASIIMDTNIQMNESLLEKFNINKMFERIIEMVYIIHKAFENNDPFLSNEIYRRDQSVNKLNGSAFELALQTIVDFPDEIKNILCLLDIISHAERIGDHIKKISEGIVFYIDAKGIKG